MVINRLLNEKALGPDGILNKVLKGITLEITIELTYNTCIVMIVFVSDPLLTYYKELIIIVLRKEGKKDYFLCRSYRPIVLENTLAKVIKKVIASRLSNVTEQYSLLL